VRRPTSILALPVALWALSCTPLADVPPAPAIPAPHESETDDPGKSPTGDRHALALTVIDCVMAPVVYDTPPWARSDEEIASFGPAAASCMSAARVVHVGSARLYRLDRDALLDLRHAIRRSPAGAPPTREAIDALSLFDQSVGAVMEGRRARTALVRETPNPSPDAIEKIRSREMLVKLDDFGRKSGGTMGAEARAIAMIVATSSFLRVARVHRPVRPYVAEPLFAMMFGSEFRPESSDELSGSWTDYIAAAARNLPGRSGGAIGGGPIEGERRDLVTLTNAVALEMSRVQVELAPGPLRVAAGRTIRELKTLDVESALSER
jgi:hypothetical protein